MEHEERVRALLREEQLLNDIVPEEYDAWVASAAGRPNVPHVGALLSSVRNSLVSLASRLTGRPETTPNKPITGENRHGLAR